jgi:aspartyl/asparaginyl-tRNA synthetase
MDFMHEKGIDPALHFRIPAYSPEFNKVIEHAHARLKQAVQTALSKTSEAWSFPMIKEIVEQAFQEVNTPATIKKDVESLTATYNQIVHAKGGHIPRRFR